MSSLGRASSNSKNTKANKLKRMDASHKAFLLEDELVRRINELNILIPELVAQGKTDEHMIAAHRLNELEDLKKWIQGEIFGLKTLGTRRPLKIWDILKYGEHGEIYRATNTVDTWNGCEVQLKQTHDRDPNLVLIIAKSPKVQNPSVNVGNIVKLVGAVTRADWVYVGKREIVTAPKRSQLITMAIEMTRILEYLKDKKLFMGKNPDVTIRFDLAKTVGDVIEVIEKHPDDFLSSIQIMNGDLYPKMNDFEVYKSQLKSARDTITYLDDDELAMRIEELLSLTFFFYSRWWGNEEWDDRIGDSLTDKEMLEIANLLLNN
ncbi:hypothetical protein JOD82_002275 [Paenibacillus sp. 1182]|uniref:hypothetical protein n=1 Tax=Paenibacillus sp. 1182 TaxID=2806565 RepID=UPI001AE16812|nr:hypothetical protein [Paenibacillus sp. 1182]MBP1309255.1 hypothetical protein [Paenibacillus sp. 1182]